LPARKGKKPARKLVTFAGEGVPDILGFGDASLEDVAQSRVSGRIFLDALLRGYQLHTEAGKGALPPTLLEKSGHWSNRRCRGTCNWHIGLTSTCRRLSACGLTRGVAPPERHAGNRPPALRQPG